jgi:hypothetical protein
LNRKVLLTFSVILILWIPLNAEARGERAPWQILDEALTYLHGMPEVAWVKFYEHKVFISWKSRPRNFARINTIAAKKAAHALHNEVTVYSLPPGETLPEELWGHEPAFLCKTIANPREIIESNCR